MVKIIQLPGGARWCLEFPDGERSATFRYESMGIHFKDNKIYVAQSCYFGDETVWEADAPRIVAHESIDNTLSC